MVARNRGAEHDLIKPSLPSEEDDEEALLMTAAQVARLLQVSLRTLWRLRSGRKLPLPVNLGAAVRWRRVEVLTWVADGCPDLDAVQEEL